MFCDRSCYTKFRRENLKITELPKNRECVKCGKKFYASPGRIKQGWGLYCSMKCRPLTKHGNGKGGTRKDLGIYVRSSWEANYARYLNFLKKNREIQDWEYEPDTFYFENIKRGTRSYTPDFKIMENDGEIIYHEVKGYMDQKSRTKLNRMKKYYPEIKIILIMKKEMMEIKNKVGAFLLWESNTNDKLQAGR